MTDDNNTASDAIQIDEDVLSYTASDEALEAAAGIEGAALSFLFCPDTQQQWRFGCLDQADEGILTPTVSDEALEAAAGTERGQAYVTFEYTIPACVGRSC
jgi:hypothetical protein